VAICRVVLGTFKSSKLCFLQSPGWCSVLVPESFSPNTKLRFVLCVLGQASGLCCALLSLYVEEDRRREMCQPVGGGWQDLGRFLVRIIPSSAISPWGLAVSQVGRFHPPWGACDCKVRRLRWYEELGPHYRGALRWRTEPRAWVSVGCGGRANRWVGRQAKPSFLKNLPVPPAVQRWLERVEGVFPLAAGCVGCWQAVANNGKLAFFWKYFKTL